MPRKDKELIKASNPTKATCLSRRNTPNLMAACSSIINSSYQISSTIAKKTLSNQIFLVKNKVKSKRKQKILKKYHKLKTLSKLSSRKFNSYNS